MMCNPKKTVSLSKAMLWFLVICALCAGIYGTWPKSEEPKSVKNLALLPYYGSFFIGVPTTSKVTYCTKRGWTYRKLFCKMNVNKEEFEKICSAMRMDTIRTSSDEILDEISRFHGRCVVQLGRPPPVAMVGSVLITGSKDCLLAYDENDGELFLIFSD